MIIVSPASCRSRSKYVNSAPSRERRRPSSMRTGSLAPLIFLLRHSHRRISHSQRLQRLSLINPRRDTSSLHSFYLTKEHVYLTFSQISRSFACRSRQGQRQAVCGLAVNGKALDKDTRTPLRLRLLNFTRLRRS